MPTKATIKLIKQLQQKKYRKKHDLFVVEGKKSVQEFLDSHYELVYIYATEVHTEDFPNAEIISDQSMKSISGFNTPPNILAVFKQKNPPLPNTISQICFALDGIQDPGNLGTIIRLADWFGMKNIFCSNNTVDLYNPKVVQASMGSICRVDVHYIDLEKIFINYNLPIIGTFMDGENLYQTDFPEKGLLVLGNEANGISTEIEKNCNKKITIPRLSKSTESLNVAIASSIIAGEIYSKKFR